MRQYIKIFGRFALFVIYAWFGLLKVIGLSPAGPLVTSLLERTLPFVAPHTFMIGLGVFEILIGILFLIPRMRVITFMLFVFHMVLVTGPLLLLPDLTWAKPLLVPTLEGQYIIKNLALIAVALNLTFE